MPRLLTDQSTYDRTVLYDTFDVTALLEAGRENVVAAELGRGWYGVTTPQEWYWQLAPYVGQPRLRAKLVVTYTDGSATTLVTDEDWLSADGPTTFDSVYSGEKYDARRADAAGGVALARLPDRPRLAPGHRADPAGQLRRARAEVPRHAARHDGPRGLQACRAAGP